MFTPSTPNVEEYFEDSEVDEKKNGSSEPMSLKSVGLKPLKPTGLKSVDFKPGDGATKVSDAIVNVLTYPIHLGKRISDGVSSVAGSIRLGTITSKPTVQLLSRRIFKLVLIGNCGAGKSSLLCRWLQNKWLGDFGTSTIGAAFCQTSFKYDQAESKMANVSPEQKVDIWDTAGQERYRAMLKLYYRGANLGLLVVDISNDHDVEGWIEEYRSNSGNMNIVLVGNKVDLLPDHSHSAEEAHGVKSLRMLAKKYELPVVLTSAYDGTGMERLIDVICQRVWAHAAASAVDAPVVEPMVEPVTETIGKCF